MFIAQYEKDLRNLCCYSGAQPYWGMSILTEILRTANDLSLDWTLDANSIEDFESSPIFDADTGFGGNGIFIDISGWTNVTRQVSGRTGGGIP